MNCDRNLTVMSSDTTGRCLLASLLLTLLILPLFEGLQVGMTLVLTGYSLTLVIAVIAATSKFRVTAWLFALVALLVGWSTLFVESSTLFALHCLLGSIFFWVAGGFIVCQVVKTPTINLDSIFGAISAYLLFGLAWALSYWAIYDVSPESFSRSTDKMMVDTSRVVDFSQCIYYSFVTMSTLGYGDITPQNRLTRTLSWIQSVTGQFYVAVVIAWLVSALPRPIGKSQ